MKLREWFTKENECSYYYNITDGRVIGNVHKIVHTKIWLSKIVYNHNEEKYLGQFISEDFAKRAVEKHWGLEDNTFISNNAIDVIGLEG